MYSNGPDRIYSAFSEIEKSKIRPGEGYPTIALGRKPFEDEVRILKDDLGQLNLIIELPKEQPKLEIKLGKVLPTKWVDLEEEGREAKTYLQVTCIDARLARTFQSLVTEMMSNVYAAPTHKPVIYEFISVASHWRTALLARMQEYSLQEASGLFGELYLLQILARINPEKALKAWRGVENYRHDFSLVNAVEVKTYTSVNEPKVTIHGAHQLDPVPGMQLHLFALHIEQNESGKSITQMIDEIVDLGIAEDYLLQKIGASYETLEDIPYLFITDEQKLFLVNQDFPGIRASVLGTNALIGLSNIQYSLNLDSCKSSIAILELEKVLRNL